MKKTRTVTIVVLLLGLAPLIAADDQLPAFDAAWTLHDLAAEVSVPVKQLAEELDLDLRKDRDRSLSALQVTRQDAVGAIERYRDRETRMVGTIVAVGMIIVYASLVVVAFLISLFQHLHFFDGGRAGRRSRSARSIAGTITSQGDLSEQSIAAVVAAIFLHEEEVDSENRLLLTWRRASSSIWRTGGTMPNSLYFASKRGR